MRKFTLPLIHIIVWLYLFYTMVFIGVEDEPVFASLLTYSTILINVAIFYFNYFFILPKITYQPNTKKTVISIVLVILFYVFLKYFIEEFFIIKILKTKVLYVKDSFIWFLNFTIIQSTMPILFSSFIWFIDNSFKVEKEKQELLQQKNDAEMSLLKSQINPHFIFNTLNNIYSLVNQKSYQSLDAIEKLGDLLRFSSTEIRKDFTSLHDEIQYLKNFIDLESLRISTPENILFEDKTENKDLKIAPMILIPFVENAFKHGNLRDFPLEISIETKNNQLHFHQKNKISISEKDKSSGIGIENVKKRLSIIYPDKHHLEILNNGDFYEVILRINL